MLQQNKNPIYTSGGVLKIMQCKSSSGFISLATALIIGVSMLFAGGVTYVGVEYKQQLKDNEVLKEQIVELQDENVASQNEDETKNPETQVTISEEPIDEGIESATYYIKSNKANVRPCKNTESSECAPVGQYDQNTELKLNYLSVEDMPEWVAVDWRGYDAYINKIVLNDEPIVVHAKEAISNTPPTSELKIVPSTWDELNKDACAKTSGCVWNDPSSGSSVSTDFVPLKNLVEQEPQTSTRETIYCNGINWNKCPAGQDFVCPTTGGAYCQSPISQVSQQQVQTQQTTQDPDKEKELDSLDEEYNALDEEYNLLVAKKDTMNCFAFLTGEAYSKCSQISIDIGVISDKQQAVLEKQAVLLGIYVAPPLTTNIRCSWINGGSEWSCSSDSGSGTGGNTQCSWISGGTVWNCN